jgi:hypothetical protein
MLPELSWMLHLNIKMKNKINCLVEKDFKEFTKAIKKDQVIPYSFREIVSMASKNKEIFNLVHPFPLYSGDLIFYKPEEESLEAKLILSKDINGNLTDSFKDIIKYDKNFEKLYSEISTSALGVIKVRTGGKERNVFDSLIFKNLMGKANNLPSRFKIDTIENEQMIDYLKENYDENSNFRYSFEDHFFGGSNSICPVALNYSNGKFQIQANNLCFNPTFLYKEKVEDDLKRY